MLQTYTAELEQIVQWIFSTMLDMDIARVECRPESPEDHLVTSIQITGAWVGSVVLSLSPDAARAAASGMLQIQHGDVTEADQQDVAAELVNMIGGNLKGLLPSPSSLSLPTVVTGQKFDLRVHEAVLSDDVLFQCDRGELRVALYVKA